jgi:hypothetical protein
MPEDDPVDRPHSAASPAWSNAHRGNTEYREAAELIKKVMVDMVSGESGFYLSSSFAQTTSTTRARHKKPSCTESPTRQHLDRQQEIGNNRTWTPIRMRKNVSMIEADNEHK